MRKMKFSIIALTCFLVLTGCKLFSSNDNLQKASPLPVFKPLMTVEKVWSTRPTNGTAGSYLRLGLSIVGDVIYTVDSQGKVVALNKKTGKRIWKIDTKTNITTTAAASKKQVVVGTGYAQVIASRTQDGRQSWFDLVSTEILAKPTLVGNNLLIKTVDGHIYAFNATNGNRLWTYDHGATALILRANSSPKVAQGIVVVGFADGKVDALSLRSGKLLWQTRVAVPQGSTAVEAMVDIDANLIIRGDTVYVASYQGNLAALNLHNGNAYWHRKLSAYTGISLANSKLFVSDAKSDLYAFTRSGGGVIWKQSKLEARSITAPTVLANKAVIVGDKEGYVHFLDQNDGHFLARVKASRSAIMATPLVSDQMLYVSSARGEVIAYRIKAS